MQKIETSFLLDFQNIISFLPEEKAVNWEKTAKLTLQVATFAQMKSLKQELSNWGATENELISEKYGRTTYQLNEKLIVVFRHYDAARAIICSSYSDFLIFRFRFTPSYTPLSQGVQHYTYGETKEILQNYEGRLTEYANPEIAAYQLNNGHCLLIDLILFEKQTNFPIVSHSYDSLEEVVKEKFMISV
jgi:hypothetical protein